MEVAAQQGKEVLLQMLQVHWSALSTLPTSIATGLTLSNWNWSFADNAPVHLLGITGYWVSSALTWTSAATAMTCASSGTFETVAVGATFLLGMNLSLKCDQNIMFTIEFTQQSTLIKQVHTTWNTTNHIFNCRIIRYEARSTLTTLMSSKGEPVERIWGSPREPTELKVSQTRPEVGLDLFDDITAKVNVSKT